MSAIELLPCPFCGEPAHRITPMGFWTPEGYSPAGVRYVCSGLYQAPSKECPGDLVAYGDDMDNRAAAAWNRRTDLSQAAVAAALEAAVSAVTRVAVRWGVTGEPAILIAANDTIRAMITDRDRDALAAHVAAEVAKARAEERDRCIKLAEYYREVCGRNQDGDFYVGDEAAQFGASVATEIIEAIAQIGAKP